MSHLDICFKTASELVELIRRKELSAKEVMEAHLKQIEAVNPKVNAIVTLAAEEAMKNAQEADEALARGEETGPLHGLPVAHKDLLRTKGLRTTFGSPIFEDYVPEKDAIQAQRLKAAGAIRLGKTNVPEFGAGSQTFNEVFGRTLNPYDPTKTCGGSSGGAAVALACGMVPIADGSDMGGSLRNPANFCNVVGFRPSPGRVPEESEMGWFQFQVLGPMGRTVQDTALMLSAMAGPHPGIPIALTESGSSFSRPLERGFEGVKIAWSPNLGELPVDQRVTATIESQRRVFDDLGCRVEEVDPDFTDADEIFQVLRAWYAYTTSAGLLEHYRDKVKDTLIWNIEKGRDLTGKQVGDAESKRTKLFKRVQKMMETYEYLILPVNQVPPFDVEQDYITEIEGVKMDTYIDWMKSCYYVTTIGLPAISVPCGFTPEGLPVGVQIVGRHQSDFSVLQLAHAFEQATGFGKQRPEIALPDR
ncbi:MAG: amidase [Proteobacteria bacterium]|nr:amidase [Pseudomonadota bacterium]